MKRSSRNDDVVARLVFGDALVHPISAAEGNVVRKGVFGDVPVERCGTGIRTRRDRKGPKHVLAGRGKVIGFWWRRSGWGVRRRRTFSLQTGTGCARAGVGRRLGERRLDLGLGLVAPECAPAPPGHADERVVDVDAHDASSAP